MTKRQVFYSFHYGNDAMRAAQVRNIGALDGNTPVSPNDWEQVKRGGDPAIQRWIDDAMRYRSCLIALIGEQTAQRQWCLYEISKAWNDGKGVIGIYIHNINCPRTGTCRKGPNPFEKVTFEDGRTLATVAPVHDPSSWNAYRDISANIERWIDEAIAIRKRN